MRGLLNIRVLTLASVVLTCAILAMAAVKKDKTIERLQRDQRTTQAQIEQTANQLEGTRNETARQLQRLDELQHQITTQEAIIASARVKSDSVKHAISSTDRRIDSISAQLAALKANYKKTLQRLQLTTSPVDELAFVLSSKNADECLNRIRYLRTYARWRRKKAIAITDKRADLDRQQQQLKTLHTEQSHQVQRLDLATRQLQTSRTDTQTLVDSLGHRQSELIKELNDRKKRLQALQNSIDNHIAQQIEQQKRQEAEKKRKAEQQRREAAKKGKEKQPKKEKQPSKSENNSKNSVIDKTPQTSARKKTEAANKPNEAIAAPDRAIQGGFEANKGNLLFPVSGRYSVVRKFGRNPHPSLSGIYIDNSGIDISVSPGTRARAVYDGTVSGIFKQDGYGTVVMVRHGSYITIYAGLADIAVRNGQELKTGQTIGTIGTQSNQGAILHFELRNERTKLNPMQWIK